jgi:hypothetical protein
MAISIDYNTLIITVPSTDMTLIDAGPPIIREININEFKKELSALQATEEGMPFDTAYTNTAPVTIGGITLARVIEIINNYTIEFEDGQYTVNVTGGNSNFSDVKVQNQVSVNTFNSAGLVALTAADVAEVSGGVWDEARADHTIVGSFGEGVASVTGNVVGSVGSVLTGVNVSQLNGSANAAALLAKSAFTMVAGTVDDTNFTPTATVFEAGDITDDQADRFVGRVIIFEDTATNERAVSDVTDYALVSGKGRFTVTGFPTAPVDGDPFIIV